MAITVTNRLIQRVRRHRKMATILRSVDQSQSFTPSAASTVRAGAMPPFVMGQIAAQPTVADAPAHAISAAVPKMSPMAGAEVTSSDSATWPETAPQVMGTQEARTNDIEALGQEAPVVQAYQPVVGATPVRQENLAAMTPPASRESVSVPTSQSATQEFGSSDPVQTPAEESTEERTWSRLQAIQRAHERSRSSGEPPVQRAVETVSRANSAPARTTRPTQPTRNPTGNVVAPIRNRGRSAPAADAPAVVTSPTSGTRRPVQRETFEEPGQEQIQEELSPALPTAVGAEKEVEKDVSSPVTVAENETHSVVEADRPSTAVLPAGDPLSHVSPTNALPTNALPTNVSSTNVSSTDEASTTGVIVARTPSTDTPKQVEAMSERPTLDQVWPVQRMSDPGPAEITTRNQPDTAPVIANAEAVDNDFPIVGHGETDEYINNSVRAVLADVPPAQVTDSVVHVMAPRRPRPTRRSLGQSANQHTPQEAGAQIQLEPSEVRVDANDSVADLQNSPAVADSESDSAPKITPAPTIGRSAQQVQARSAPDVSSIASTAPTENVAALPQPADFSPTAPRPNQRVAEPPTVLTEIGELPSDLWSLLDEPIPNDTGPKLSEDREAEVPEQRSLPAQSGPSHHPASQPKSAGFERAIQRSTADAKAMTAVKEEQVPNVGDIDLHEREENSNDPDRLPTTLPSYQLSLSTEDRLSEHPMVGQVPSIVDNRRMIDDLTVTDTPEADVTTGDIAEHNVSLQPSGDLEPPAKSKQSAPQNGFSRPPMPVVMRAAEVDKEPADFEADALLAEDGAIEATNGADQRASMSSASNLEESGADSPNNDKNDEDISELARQVYAYLQRKLVVERERLG